MAADLNRTVRRPAASHVVDGGMEVWFDQIAGRLCELIGEAHAVAGAMAWLTDRELLQALRDLEGGAAVVVTNDTSNRRVAAQYRSVPGRRPGEDAVRMLGAGRGRGRPFMHHKFLVGLDRAGAPLWCATGSYNGTRNSRHSLENVLVSRDAGLAGAYLQEWAAVWAAARPVPMPRARKRRKV
jgi:phosphatidylserine/phosphatidylglycerophosphate/cardiolipin synthase-like enzyme